jgi:hypothetical protein
MKGDDLRRLIETGNVDGLRYILQSEPTLANQTIDWHLNQHNRSDPLHFVADSVAQGWLDNGREGEIVELLLAHGASINGTAGRESPLIGSPRLAQKRSPGC